MSHFDPILTIKKFVLTDSLRPGLGRIPGACQVLKNLIPSLTGAERVRPGYSAYSESMPTGLQILKTLPLDSPESCNLHLKFANDGTQKVFVNPSWNSGVKSTDDLQIGARATNISGAGISVALNEIIIASATATFGSQPMPKHGWIVAPTGRQRAQITTVTLISDVLRVYTLEDLDVSTGLGYLGIDTFNFYAHFHEAIDIGSRLPAYNNDKTIPPTANVENSVVRFSGGIGSNSLLQGIYLNPSLKRTFFPGSGRPFTYDATYATKRSTAPDHTYDFYDIKALDAELSGGHALTVTLINDQTRRLPKGKTYWLGLAPVYDDYQIGKLVKYTTVTDYYFTSGLFDYNYLANWQDDDTGHWGGVINCYFDISMARLNKRITGFMIYLAIDEGKTYSPQSPFMTLKYLPLCDSEFAGWGNLGIWNYRTTDTSIIVQKYRIAVPLDGFDVNNMPGTTYQDDSGYTEDCPDTMYAYSIEEIIGTRRVMSNAYVTSESFNDRANVFLNALGGSDLLGNAGFVQPDIFPNEPARYRLKCEPTVGSSINAIVQTGQQEFLAIKDYGIVLQRIVDVGNIPNLNSTIIADFAGSATINEVAFDDDGWVYFASYQDIFRYKDGVLQALIESQDHQDWLWTYQNTITETEKENASIVYLPELKSILFLFGNNRTPSEGYNDMQYMFNPKYGWRGIAFKEVSNKATVSFKWLSTSIDGYTIGVTTDTVPVVKLLLWNTSGGAYYLYYSDDGTAIAPEIDTGDFMIADGRDLRLDKIIVQTIYDALASGQLDCKIYLDGALVRTYSDLDRADMFLSINSLSDDVKIGTTLRFHWNSNLTNRAGLTPGNQLQIEGILIHGDTIPRRRYGTSTLVSIQGEGMGTVNGLSEVTLNQTPQTFTWDKPFTKTYIGAEGANIPTYRILQMSAHPISGGVQDTTVECTVCISAQTLTTFTAYADSDNVLFKFKCEEA